MAYADQQMSGNKITALIVVAILHVLVGYALVTGLAYSAFKKIKEVTPAVKIEDDKPKEPPPPPPKQDAPPPPIVAPPPPIQLNVAPPPIQAVSTPPPPVIVPVVPASPPPPPPPPAPRFSPKAAVPKGSPASWATPDDYPTSEMRQGVEGTTRFRVSIGPDGRVTGCEVTGSSGNGNLDAKACQVISRRARFTPAMDGEGNPTAGSFASSVRWVIPKD